MSPTEHEDKLLCGQCEAQIGLVEPDGNRIYDIGPTTSEHVINEAEGEAMEDKVKLECPDCGLLNEVPRSDIDIS